MRTGRKIAMVTLVLLMGCASSVPIKEQTRREEPPINGYPQGVEDVYRVEEQIRLEGPPANGYPQEIENVYRAALLSAAENDWKITLSDREAGLLQASFRYLGRKKTVTVTVKRAGGRTHVEVSLNPYAGVWQRYNRRGFYRSMAKLLLPIPE